MLYCLRIIEIITTWNLIFTIFMLLYQIFYTGLQHQGRIFGCSCCIACELAKNQYRRNIRLEFCPPNPKAFVMAVSTVILRHSPRTKSRSESQSSRFNVGGTIPSRIAWIQAIASVMPPAPIMWPVAPFVELMAEPSNNWPSAFNSASSPSFVTVQWALK